MQKPKTSFRVTERRSFGPSLEWQYDLPIVGEDRQRRAARALAWKIVLVGLALFWGVGAALLWLVV